MSWGLSDSACDPGVKRSGNGAPGALRVVPHAVAATGSVKFEEEHSGQRDFVKLDDLLITTDRGIIMHVVGLF